MLDVGHRGLIGGHFSHNKMADNLSQHFTWPGIWKDIRAYRSACAECQRAGRQHQKYQLYKHPLYQYLTKEWLGI